jgi:hypothetical protein
MTRWLLGPEERHSLSDADLERLAALGARVSGRPHSCMPGAPAKLAAGEVWTCECGSVWGLERLSAGWAWVRSGG